MSRVLPILFNTDMVRAILDGRKTVTRRLVKPQLPDACPSCKCMNVDYIYDNNVQNIYCARCGEPFYPEKKSPYQAEDLLYVRETWANLNTLSCPCYYYKASDNLPEWALGGWKPSIHMPKEAARIWLKVTDVRVERLQDIMKDPPGPKNQVVREGCKYGCDFIAVWENTVRKEERNSYGWDANPWVWVIEFERCEKPESEG